MKFEHTETYGWDGALRGARNPMDSWKRGDSGWKEIPFSDEKDFVIGPNDKDLALRLIKAGPEHAKFLRQIFASVDITAPRYWWIEQATYRFGVEVDSCSTMHKIMAKPFTREDFEITGSDVWLDDVIGYLNGFRDRYLETSDKTDWYSVIDALPQSYLQKRTLTMSYAAIANMCRQRKNHKLYQWHKFVEWAHTLPNAFLIFGEDGAADGRTDG